MTKSVPKPLIQYLKTPDSVPKNPQIRAPTDPGCASSFYMRVRKTIVKVFYGSTFTSSSPNNVISIVISLIFKAFILVLQDFYCKTAVFTESYQQCYNSSVDIPVNVLWGNHLLPWEETCSEWENNMNLFPWIQILQTLKHPQYWPLDTATYNTWFPGGNDLQLTESDSLF